MDEFPRDSINLWNFLGKVSNGSFLTVDHNIAIKIIIVEPVAT